MLQGGRGPFNVTVSEDLGKLLIEEEEVELTHCEEGAEAILRSIFTVKRLDAQGRVIDDDTEKKIKDSRAARRLERNMLEREHRLLIVPLFSTRVSLNRLLSWKKQSQTKKTVQSSRNQTLCLFRFYNFRNQQNRLPIL